MEKLPEHKKIILFDGFCNVCDAWVQFIIQRDPKDIFRFVSLQSDLGLKLQKKIGIDSSKTDSVILYEPGKAYYYKSKAVFEILASIGGIWNLFQIFRILPIFITDYLYDFVARNRYKWFGKKDNCMIPTKEIQAKFL